MIDSINNLFFFRKNFQITYLRKYKFRSLARAFVFKLDFELFVTAQSSRLLKEKWELDISYQSNTGKINFLSYCDNLIDFKSSLNKLKLKKTVFFDNFEFLNEDNLTLLNKNYQITDDFVLSGLSDISKNEVKSVFDRIYQVRHIYLGLNADILSNWRFRPALYDEPLFLEKMLRFKKRPDIKSRRLEMIDRYNYHLIIKFLSFNLRKKLNLLGKNIKILSRFFKKFFYFKFFLMFRKYTKNYRFLKKNLKIFKKYSKFFFDKNYHKLILLEYRKLQTAFFSFKKFLNIRFFVLNKYFIYLRNDLAFYLSHLKSLYKRSRNFAWRINELMRIYHVGFQYIYKKIKQFFFDFFIVVKVIIRDLLVVNNLFWRFISFLKKICQFFLKTTNNLNISFFYTNLYSFLSFVVSLFVQLKILLSKKK